ncbi:hypothetical protein COT68_03230 [bacterium (Candidatus Torokbacteria) CG09_land_8_20_14_0_10_42_11]|nr:MAG: hypothetical protein COT68_03230 [bacterium (Candidatus Torokbacteria) CG09_land_8_20_14_0_10_42_11]
MPYLKSLSNRKKNLLTFAIGFVVGVAVFWGLWWLVMDRFDIYRELGIYLLMPGIAILFPLAHIMAYMQIDLGVQAGAILTFGATMIGWGMMFSLFFLLLKWFFVKLKH